MVRDQDKNSDKNEYTARSSRCVIVQNLSKFTLCVLILYDLSRKNLLEFKKNVFWISAGKCSGWIFVDTVTGELSADCKTPVAVLLTCN